MQTDCKQPDNKVIALGVGEGEGVCEVGDAAQRMYARHPKKKDLPLVCGALEESVKLKPLPEIEAVHAAWCETEDWTKNNGQYCPPLARWLFDRGYTQWPQGTGPAVIAPPPKPIKVVPYDPLGIGANGGIPRPREAK